MQFGSIWLNRGYYYSTFPEILVIILYRILKHFTGNIKMIYVEKNFVWLQSSINLTQNYQIKN